MNTILNQGNKRNCGIWAVCAILIHNNVVFDIEKITNNFAPYIPLIEKLFIESGLIDKFIKIPTTRLVDLWLRKWEYLLTWTNLGNFTSSNVTFDWKSNHWFVICEDCWDRYKIQNSWGIEWGENWYWYIKKSDFSKLFTPRRIVIKKISV